jgi:outer membrane usher protein
MASGGASFSFRLPVGEMEVSTAASASAAPGAATFVGFSYLGRNLNFGASARFISPHYATTSLSHSDKRSWLQFNALIGFPVAYGIGVSLRYTHDNSQIDQQSHRFSVATTARLTNRMSLFLNAGLSRHRNGNSGDAFTGLTFLFGETTSSIAYQNFEGASASALTLQKSLPVGSGFGYRLQAASSAAGDQSPTLDSLVQYQGAYGRYEANYTRLNGKNSTLLSTAGGVAVIGGDFFLTRPVQDSFALIQVPGVPGVRGFSSNQEVGTSNTRGNLFVANLLPYYGNKLGISDKDIPLNYTVAATEKVVATPFRGGAVVTFPVQRVQMIVGKIVLDDSGAAAIPAYGQLVVSANGKEFDSPIGKQGEFYLENLAPGRYLALVQYREQQCNFAIDIPDVDALEVKLGTLKCPLQ